jgi:hypothetical protein
VWAVLPLSLNYLASAMRPDASGILFFLASLKSVLVNSGVSAQHAVLSVD